MPTPAGDKQTMDVSLFTKQAVARRGSLSIELLLTPWAIVVVELVVRNERDAVLDVLAGPKFSPVKVKLSPPLVARVVSAGVEKLVNDKAVMIGER